MKSILKILRHQLVLVVLWGYRNLYIPFYSTRIRKKNKIRILFVLTSLGSWKTETLFRKMLNHKRFSPQILILKGMYFEDDRSRLQKYCSSKGYPYSEIDEENETINQKFKPDIIIYQKPYKNEYPAKLEFKFNLKSLFIFVPYAMRNTNEPWAWNTPMLRHAWQIYYENESIYNEYIHLKKEFRKSGRLTGTPFQDDLLLPKDKYKNPWINSSPSKVRIIYAPHHSFEEYNQFDTGTFLQFGEAILDIAKSMSDKVQWAFKPHPVFRKKLELYWNKEKIDYYFEEWANLGQVEEGEYLGLFKHSDAMIHDCGSFVVEYITTGNPVLYIDKKGSRMKDTFNSTYAEALRLHYHAADLTQIEHFIKNVISGNDPRKNERMNYQTRYLTPPFNQTACQNIIDSILYSKRDKDYNK